MMIVYMNMSHVLMLYIHTHMYIYIYIHIPYPTPGFPPRDIFALLFTLFVGKVA